MTLTGPGGSGKTRLALEVSRRLAEPLRGDVWFARLADLTDPRLISDQILAALRLPHLPGISPLDQVITFLTSGIASSERPAILVLDNFEHLVDEGAQVVQSLLERVERLRILVTSRRRLDLSGEQEFAVGPLPVPVDGSWSGTRAAGGVDGSDAPASAGPSTSNHQLSTLADCPSVLLFLDRAQAACPDFQITAGNAEAVARLCERLEGLPLALELAAARARALTPGQMLARLQQGFDLLVSRHRDVDPRHHSLRATLDWSYQLLSPALRRLFAHLSVFRGGWSLEAAEDVCSVLGVGADIPTPNIRHPTPNTQHPTPVLDGLEQLQECSLVMIERPRSREAGSGQASGTSTAPGEALRFRMLESLREYAAEHLSAEERDNLSRRHLGYFLSLAEQAEQELLGADQAGWLDRLEQEHDNLRAALEWATARASAAPGEGCSPAEALVLGLRLGGALWGFWWIRGCLSEGRQRLTRLLQLAPVGTPEVDGTARTSTPEDDRALAKAQACAAVLAHFQGDFGAARLLYEESLARQRKLGDAWGMAFSLTGLAFVSEHHGDFPAVYTYEEEGLSLWRQLGNRSGMAWSLNNLGDVAFRQGELARARALFEESLALRHELGDQWGAAFSLAGLGDVALGEGDRTAAVAYHEESLAIRRSVGDRPGMAWSLHHLAQLAQEQNDLETARRLYSECLAIHRAIGARWGIATALASLGELLLAQRDPATARPLLTESLALRQELGDDAGAAACRKLLGRASQTS